MYGRKIQEIEKSSCKVPCPLKLKIFVGATNTLLHEQNIFYINNIFVVPAKFYGSNKKFCYINKTFLSV